jgi:tetratricopeptide (TPR) repeat protein
MGSILQAQEDRITEEDINVEQAFIEALALRMNGQPDKALQKLEELSNQDRRNPALLYEIARIQIGQEKYNEALITIDRAIRIDGEQVWYRELKVGILEFLGNYVGAIEELNALIELQPYQVELYFRKCEYHLQLNNPSAALATLDDLIQKVGLYEQAHQRKYDIYRNVGDLNKAAEELKSLLLIEPRNTEYMYLLASHYNQIGNKKEANKLYEKILQIDPSNAKATLELNNSEKNQMGDVAYLRSLQKLFSDSAAELDPKIIELIPFVEKLGKRQDPELPKVLLELVDILDNVHKKEAKVAAIRGDILQYSGQLEAAIEAYKVSLTLSKKKFSVWEQLMVLQLDQADFHGLLNSSEDALDYFPNQHKVWILNARAHRGLKDYENALYALDQAQFMAVGQQAAQQEILCLKAAIWYDKGNLIKAEQLFDDALKLNPDHPNTLSKKILYLAQDASTYEKAKSLATAQSIKTNTSPLLKGTYAIVLYKQDKSAAIQYLQSIQQNHSQEPTMRYLEELMTGNIVFEELLKIWRFVIEGGPS